MVKPTMEDAMAEASTRPWQATGPQIFHKQTGQTLADCHGNAPFWTDFDVANAALIVKCVNLHDELVEMLRKVLPWMNTEVRLARGIYDEAVCLIAKAEAE